MLSDSAAEVWDVLWFRIGHAFSMNDAGGVLLVLVCLALWLGVPAAGVFFGLKAMRLKRLMQELPTCKARGVFVGQVEMKGRAVSEVPLVSFLAECPCVWYEYAVEEHWRRVRVETYTDSKGNARTRTVVETGWESVASGKSMQPFFLEDETGSVLVRPEGATMEPDAVFSRQCGMSDPLYYAKGPDGAVANSTHERRFTESAIPVESRLYLLGTARERQDCAAAEVAESAHSEDVFLISRRSEEAIASSSAWKLWVYPLGGLLVLLFGTVMWLGEGGSAATYEKAFASCSPLLWQFGLYFSAVWLGGAAWAMYQGLVRMRHRVNAAWAMIEVQLQRRHTLVPDLVRVVEGYAAHERMAQEALAGLRAALEVGSAEFLARTEAYPSLKADALFAELSARLVDTEDRVALAREYFNTLAGHFNAAQARFPDVLFARLLGMKAVGMWRPEDSEAVNRPPQV